MLEPWDGELHLSALQAGMLLVKLKNEEIFVLHQVICEIIIELCIFSQKKYYFSDLLKKKKNLVEKNREYFVLIRS